MTHARKAAAAFMAVVVAFAMSTALTLPLASTAHAATKAKSVTLYVDSATKGTTTLKASGLKAKKATWKSSKKKVATVKAGKVTAKKAGKATITAKQGKKTYKFNVTVKKVSISKKKATLEVGNTLTLKLTGDKVKAAKSSAAKVATVTKAGKVTAKKAGKATITLTSKKGKKYTCKVTVKAKAKSGSSSASSSSSSTGGKKGSTSSSSGSATGGKSGSSSSGSGSKTTPTTVAVSGVTLEPSALTLEVDEKATLTATVAPSNATNKAVTFKSTNTEVAVVDEAGKVTARSAGVAEITASAGGKTATCRVTVTAPDPNPTVSTQEELAKLLNSDQELESITLQTQGQEDVAIRSDVQHSDTKLIIEAPNATVDNYVKFGGVTIRDIARDTYVEHAGNSIDFEAENGHVVVADDADSGSFICIRPTADAVVVENNGKLNGLDIQTDGNVVIAGESDEPVPTELSAPATVTTSVVLDITVTMENGAQSKAKLVLGLGAEAGTTITVTNVEVIPNVEGVGSVVTTVVNPESGNVEDSKTVVAENNGQGDGEDAAKVNVAGKIVDGESNAAIAGATVALYLWTSSVAAGDFSGATANATATADASGAYSISSVPLGNYVLVASAEGYKKVTSDLLLANTAGDKNITLVKEVADEQPGVISGQLIDSSQSGSVGIEGITLRLRAGSGNVTGEVLATAKTGEDGSYSFNGIEPGVYTVEAVDLRSDESTRYVESIADVTVLSGEETSCNLSMTPVIERGQLRFVLRWKAKGTGVPSDLDSHLYGPGSAGGMFHTWYSDTNYYSGDDNLIAWLDRDDTDYEGPETTTVEKLSSGAYTFFIHDYSNENDREDTMLATSGATVEVYSGASLIRTYTVPAGKGNVWAVCSYSKQGGLADINKLMGADSASTTGDDYLYGGLRATSVQTNDFVTSYEFDGNGIRLWVAGSMTPDKLDQIKVEADGGTAQAVYDDGDYYVRVTGEDGTARTYNLYFSVDYGDLCISDFETNDVVTDYDVGGSEVYLTVTDRDFDAYKDFVKPAFGKEGVSYKVLEDEDHNPYIEITDGALTRSYYIYTRQDYGDLAITGFEFDEVVADAKVGSSRIDLWVTDTDFDVVKGHIKPIIPVADATFEIYYGDEDDGWYITIAKGDLSRTYYFDEVNYDSTGGLRISSVNKNDIDNMFIGDAGCSNLLK